MSSTKFKGAARLFSQKTGRPDTMNDSEKIISLEEKIAWLEDQLNEQGQELTDLARKYDELARQFKLLYSKVGDPYAVRSLKDEVPPPHY